MMTCWCNRCFHSFSGAPIGWSPTSHGEVLFLFVVIGIFNLIMAVLLGSSWRKPDHPDLKARWLRVWWLLGMDHTGVNFWGSTKSRFFYSPSHGYLNGKTGKSSRLNMAMDHHRTVEGKALIWKSIRHRWYIHESLRVIHLLCYILYIYIYWCRFMNSEVWSSIVLNSYPEKSPLQSPLHRSIHLPGT